MPPVHSIAALCRLEPVSLWEGEFADLPVMLKLHVSLRKTINLAQNVCPSTRPYDAQLLIVRRRRDWAQCFWVTRGKAV